MKTNPDLDQWLVKPVVVNNPASSVDHLAAFKKLTISSTQPALFRLPSILTSDNAATWLVTRKGAAVNNEAPTPSSSIKSHMTKIGKDDNAKWLLRPETPAQKVETDLVVISDELSPWLARSVMTTSLNTLPGKRSSLTTTTETLKNSSLDQWLLKPNKNQLVSKTATGLEEWLWVPNRSKYSAGDDPLGDWKKKSLSQTWIDHGSASPSMDQSKVQEWLKKALDNDDNDMDDSTDSSSSDEDDDESFEVISQSSS